MGRVENDLLFNIIGSVMLVLLLVLTLINDPNEAETKDDIVRDEVVVDLYWGPPVGQEIDRDDDLDLWVMGPGDFRPVGYSAKTGSQFALMRDVTRKNLAPINHEQAASNVVVPGRYTVNIHFFRQNSRSPTKGRIVISIKGEAVHTETVLMLFPGQERTVMSFDLDLEGNLSNVGTAPRPLRNMGSAS